MNLAKTMPAGIKALVRQVVRKFGFDVIRYHPWHERSLPADLSDDEGYILARVSEYTMTSVERQVALVQAVRHIVRSGIPGCMVECGVWKGGSSMICALALILEEDTNRTLYLYDTFEGMTPPNDIDKTVNGEQAAVLLANDTEDGWIRCLATMDEVRQNLQSTGYPEQKIQLVQGPVEKTLPTHAPNEPIALLRLDTD